MKDFSLAWEIRSSGASKIIKNIGVYRVSEVQCRPPSRGVSMKRYMRSIDRRTNILVLTKTSNSSNIGLLKGGFDCIDTRRGSYCSVSSWRVSLWIIASSTVWFYKIGATRRSIWWSLNSTMRPAELIHQINRWLNIAYRIERHYGEGKMWKIWGNSGRWNKTCAW